MKFRFVKKNKKKEFFHFYDTPPPPPKKKNTLSVRPSHVLFNSRGFGYLFLILVSLVWNLHPELNFKFLPCNFATQKLLFILTLETTKI